MKKKKVSTKISLKKSVSSTFPSNLIVKIIAIFGYVSAVSGIILSMLLLFKEPTTMSMLPMTELTTLLGSMMSTFVLVLAIMILLFAGFWIFLSRSLWLHKNWARIAFIVLASIGLINSAFSLPSTIFSLLANGAIIYFLAFDKNVVALFK